MTRISERGGGEECGGQVGANPAAKSGNIVKALGAKDAFPLKPLRCFRNKAPNCPSRSLAVRGEAIGDNLGCLPPCRIYPGTEVRQVGRTARFS